MKSLIFACFLLVLSISAQQVNQGQMQGQGQMNEQSRPQVPCGQFEERKQCGTACELSCQNPNPTCTRQCIPNVCQCRSGYVRDSSTNRCVRQNQCRSSGSSTTRPGQQCGRNETFRTCGSACEPTCQNPQPQACTMQCISNVCQCSQGFVRGSNGCVRRSEC